MHQFAGFTGFDVRMFDNGREFPGVEGQAGNDDSVVFQVRYQLAPNVLVSALFTGDIESEQGEMLVQQFGNQLQSDIVKVPHHGSAEVFPGFPTAVEARFAFVSSSGAHGNHKHSRKTPLDLYDATGTIFLYCARGVPSLLKKSERAAPDACGFSGA